MKGRLCVSLMPLSNHSWPLPCLASHPAHHGIYVPDSRMLIFLSLPDQALSASVTEDELSADNTAVALVGKGTPFTILEGNDLKPHLATLKAEDDAPLAGESFSVDVSLN